MPFPRIILSICSCLLLGANVVAQTSNTSIRGKIITEKITSAILKENLVGLETIRRVKIYLPPGYDTSGKSYPVVYYLHSIYGSAEMVLEEGVPSVRLLERAFAAGIVKEFIFVVPDYSSAAVGSLYENSVVSGRWLDYTTQELMPFIDSRFRTLRNRDSRAFVGDFMGGRGALKLAMTRADLFSVVYAMHPVATGTGYLPWTDLGIDWKNIYQAKSSKDIPHGSAHKFF